jgi:hypothetical protein
MPSEEEYRQGLRHLAADAKQADERAYVIATLLFMYMRGSSDDYQAEMRRTFREFRLLLERADDLPRTLRFKVNLLVYCHILEAHPVYVYVWNLVRIAAGHPHKQYPFGRDSIQNKVEKIKAAARGSSYGIETMLDEVIDLDLRNAFTHNQYVLGRVGKTFARDGRFVSYEALTETLSKAQAFYQELADGAERGTAFLQSEGEDVFRGRDGSALTITRTRREGTMDVQMVGL